MDKAVIISLLIGLIPVGGDDICGEGMKNFIYPSSAIFQPF